MFCMLDEQSAWSAVDGAVRHVWALGQRLRAQITSIIVAGSLVRGDFIADNSDVDMHVVLRGHVEVPWASQAYRAVSDCFDRAVSPYRGRSHSPRVWDGVCVSEAGLLRSATQAAAQRYKAFGIYLFDLVAHHRTVYGRDVLAELPEPPDPKSLVIPRLDRLCRQAQAGLDGPAEHRARIPMLGVEAVKALQLYFGGEPSIHKRAIAEVYAEAVPPFAMKPFGLELWRCYTESRYPDGRQASKPLAETVEFVRQARRLV
jgi:predicted nucleotidyltransferase